MTSSIAAIHVAKKFFDLDDDTYRAKLARITGKSSAKDMSEAERQTVLTVFRNEGFVSAPAARRADGRQKLTGKFAKKLQALWIAAWNLGIVRERDDKALVGFVKRQTGIDHTRFLNYADDGSKAIDALKGWIARDGGVDWSNAGLHPQAYMRAFGYKIASAQWSKLAEDQKRFWPEVVALIGGDVLDRHLSEEQWVRVMNAFGERLRKRGAA